MTTPSRGQSAIDLRPVARGSPLLADEWNKIRRFLFDAQDKRVTRLVREQQGQRSWAEVMLHEITAINGDYVTCLRVWRNDTLGSEVVFVARPPLLRRSVTDHDGVTYVYTDDQTRTASKSGETDETQLITPTYVIGDRIEVIIKRGLTGITEVDEQRGRPIDKNVDSRAWAALPA